MVVKLWTHTVVSNEALDEGCTETEFKYKYQNSAQLGLNDHPK